MESVFDVIDAKIGLTGLTPKQASFEISPRFYSGFEFIKMHLEQSFKCMLLLSHVYLKGCQLIFLSSQKKMFCNISNFVFMLFMYFTFCFILTGQKFYKQIFLLLRCRCLDCCLTYVICRMNKRFTIMLLYLLANLD